MTNIIYNDNESPNEEEKLIQDNLIMIKANKDINEDNNDKKFGCPFCGKHIFCDLIEVQNHIDSVHRETAIEANEDINRIPNKYFNEDNMEEERNKISVFDSTPETEPKVNDISKFEPKAFSTRPLGKENTNENFKKISSNNDLIIDGIINPDQEFNGSSFYNDSNICYLNAIINCLLTLSTFRKLIQFMKNITIRNLLTQVLTDAIGVYDSQQVRTLIEKINKDKEFTYNKQSDSYEALSAIYQVINLPKLYQESAIKQIVKSKCQNCQAELGTNHLLL